MGGIVYFVGLVGLCVGSVLNLMVLRIDFLFDVLGFVLFCVIGFN